MGRGLLRSSGNGGAYNLTGNHPESDIMNRRNFLLGCAAATTVATAGWASPSRIRLDAESVTVQLIPGGEIMTPMFGYNGMTPGPEIRTREGERIAIEFRNHIDRPSAVHWHGIHIENGMDGVPGLTQAAIPPGGKFDYEFTAPYPGTYWYHSHERSWEQVAKGLYGPLIVEERHPPRVDHDITVVLDDWRLTREGTLHPGFGNSHDFSHAGRIGNYARAMFSRNTVRLRDRVRLRLINAATARTFEVKVDGGDGRVVAHDGMPLKKPGALGELLLAPAQRTDLIVDVRGSVNFFLRTRRGPFNLGTITAGGVNPAPIDAPITALPTPTIPEPDRKRAKRLILTLQGGAMGGRHGGNDFWAFNDFSGMPERPWQHFARGETVLITMRNETAFPHGVHIHGHHFLEVREDGSLGHYRDTTLVMPRQRRDVLCMFNNPGKWLIHCHTLAHQATGMKTWVEVS